MSGEKDSAYRLITALAARGIAPTSEAAFEAFKQIARAEDPDTLITLLKEVGALSPNHDEKSEAASLAARPYRAFEASKEEQRYLEMRLKFPESAESYSNAMLTGIRADCRMGGFITLEYGKTREGLLMMVVIEGDNLLEVYRAIKEWKAEWIAEFDPQEHAPPSDAKAPFIRSIVIHAKRPEESPPANKRH